MSVSTEKLNILVNALNRVPDSVLARVKSFSLDWKELGIDPHYPHRETVVVPTLKVEFFDEDYMD